LISIDDESQVAPRVVLLEIVSSYCDEYYLNNYLSPLWAWVVIPPSLGPPQSVPRPPSLTPSPLFAYILAFLIWFLESRGDMKSSVGETNNSNACGVMIWWSHKLGGLPDEKTWFWWNSRVIVAPIRNASAKVLLSVGAAAEEGRSDIRSSADKADS